MANKKKVVELIVVGDAKSCDACKKQKAFMAKNKKAIDDAGVTKVRFVNPDSPEAELYQRKYTGGMKAQPLTVIKNDEQDTAFAGFGDGTGFIGEIKKGVKAVDTRGFFEKIFG